MSTLQAFSDYYFGACLLFVVLFSVGMIVKVVIDTLKL